MQCLTVSNAELCHVFRRGQCTVSTLLLAWLQSVFFTSTSFIWLMPQPNDALQMPLGL